MHSLMVLSSVIFNREGLEFFCMVSVLFSSIVHNDFCLRSLENGETHDNVAGRGTSSRAQEWALVYHSEMNFLRRHTC